MSAGTCTVGLGVDIPANGEDMAERVTEKPKRRNTLAKSVG